MCIRDIVLSFAAGSILCAGAPLSAATLPPPARCDTRIPVKPGETMTIYTGINPKHFRLSVAGIGTDHSISPISGDENNFQNISAKLDSGASVPVPFGLGAVDVESTNITVTNAAANKSAYFVCFESIP